MAAELLNPVARATDSNGRTYSGAVWRFYASGTTTPQAVYADAVLSVSLGATVTADSGGKFVPIYFDSDLEYRGVLKNNSGSVTIADIDPINDSTIATFLERISGPNGSSEIGFVQDGADAVARNVENELRETLKPQQFGAIGDRNTDNLAAFDAAIAQAKTFDQYPSMVTLPSGHYYRSNTVDVPGHLLIRGSGPSCILNSEGKNQTTPVLSNEDPYGLVNGIFQDFSIYGGSHGLKLDADSENAGLVFSNVAMLLQTTANIEANKLFQTSYFFGGTLALAPYGLRVNALTTNAVAFYGTHFTDHGACSLRLRGVQGLLLSSPRFEGRGAPPNQRIRVVDGAITAGSRTFTSASASFGAAQVGRGIVIQGAGPLVDPGQPLGPREPLRTAIMAVVNANTLTLYDPAEGTVGGVVTDIHGPSGATIDVEDVNGAMLIQAPYIEATQEAVLRARRARNIVFDSPHFTGQNAGFESNSGNGWKLFPYKWDVDDDTVVTIRNGHSNDLMETPRRVRLEGEQTNIYPSYENRWGNDFAGGLAVKSGRPTTGTFNIIDFRREILDGTATNVAGLSGRLRLFYLGYNPGALALRRMIREYRLLVTAAAGTSGGALQITLTENTDLTVTDLQGGTISTAVGSTDTMGVISLTLGGNFNVATEASMQLAIEMDWHSLESAPSDVIKVRAF